MKDFAGKIAFITGAASGAGLGQAKVFAKAGMKIVMTDLRDEDLIKAAKAVVEYSGCKEDDVLPLRFDLTDREAFIAAADKAEEAFGGPPHLLIQTAGVNSFGPAEASTFDDYDWVMGVCLNAVINGLVIFVPRMIKAYANKTECHVVTTSSMGGWRGNVTTAPYCAAKAAVNNLMESYYLALKPYGFGVTSLCPQGINSDIWATELRRPENLKNSGYNTTPEVIETIKGSMASGIDPIELGEKLKAAIEDGLVYCIPLPNAFDLVTRRNNIRRNYISKEGMIQEEALAEYTAKVAAELAAKDERAAQRMKSGFGKARSDNDWVDVSRRAK